MSEALSITETRGGWVLLETSATTVGSLLAQASALPPPEGEDSLRRLAPLRSSEAAVVPRSAIREALAELVRLLERHGAAWKASGALISGSSSDSLRKAFAAALAELDNHAESAEFRVDWG